MSSTTRPDVRWLSDDEQLAWRGFIMGVRRLIAHLDRDLKAHGITHEDYGVLVALSESECGRLRMADLADLAVESRSRMSHHIGRLEARGLVERVSCEADRRGSFAVLTPKGRTTIEELAPFHVEGVRQYFLDHVSPAELATIGEAFTRIGAELGSIERS